LVGKMALGHTRYSTAGRSSIENAQPMVIQTLKGQIAVAQNGNLTTAKSLKQILMQKGVGMFRTSDVEIITQMLAANPTGSDSDTWESRIASFMKQADGAYSLAIMTSDAVFGARDFLGMRPLCIGRIKVSDTVTRYVIASETCAISTIGGEYIREVQPGEIVRLDESGLHSFVGRPPAPERAFCVFEYVYFARPDSLLEDQLVHQVRQRLGMQLALESPPPAPLDDLRIIGVPDSSLPAAIGYAAQCGVPYSEGLVKNRYIHRTFIQPSDYLRRLGVTLKFNPLAQNIKGKRLVLVDDSIVRGNTIKALVALLRGAGAVEVHVRISSPPVRHPCFMGIDMATYEQLTSHNLTPDQVCVQIGADSLRFLSHEGMMKVVSEFSSHQKATTSTQSSTETTAPPPTAAAPTAPTTAATTTPTTTPTVATTEPVPATAATTPTPAAAATTQPAAAPTTTTTTATKSCSTGCGTGYCSACFTGKYPLKIDDW